MPRTQSARFHVHAKQRDEVMKKEVAGWEDAATAMAVANACAKKKRVFRRYTKPSSYSEIHT